MSLVVVCPVFRLGKVLVVRFERHYLCEVDLLRKTCEVWSKVLGDRHIHSLCHDERICHTSACCDRSAASLADTVTESVDV